MPFVILEGAAELTAQLDALGKTVAGKILRRAVRDGTKIVLAEAKRRCPVRTGALKKNLKIKRPPRTPRGLVVLSIDLPPRARLGIDPKDEWYYPAIVEFLHKPFLRPAFDAKKAVALAAAGEAIRGGIDEATR